VADAASFTWPLEQIALTKLSADSNLGNSEILTFSVRPVLMCFLVTKLFLGETGFAVELN
jgi:hypothetical protein